MSITNGTQDFCELFKRAETVVGCHRETYNNDNIRVSPWDGPNRRVAFLAPYQAPGWVKKTIGALTQNFLLFNNESCLGAQLDVES